MLVLFMYFDVMLFLSPRFLAHAFFYLSDVGIIIVFTIPRLHGVYSSKTNHTILIILLFFFFFLMESFFIVWLIFFSFACLSFI